MNSFSQRFQAFEVSVNVPRSRLIGYRPARHFRRSQFLVVLQATDAASIKHIVHRGQRGVWIEQPDSSTNPSCDDKKLSYSGAYTPLSFPNNSELILGFALRGAQHRLAADILVLMLCGSITSFSTCATQSTLRHYGPVSRTPAKHRV
jgi:hypothetical protein